MHALVVGGTGMLKDVCLSLNQQRYITTVIARDPNRMNTLVSESTYSDLIKRLLVDWNDQDKLLKALKQTMDENGPFDLVVYWSAGDALPKILDLIGGWKKEKQWDLYHVKGSMASRPETRNIPVVPSHCRYHEIILGFQLQADGARWLTHEEISTGVIDAIEKQRDQKIIGTVEPWNRRPSW
ncbi:MAG TPA: short-chain dehydrogenase [Sporolactobacillaceae bacterium]|nr:short-chain dehydrogenase [Sporolactobacillaceae bacterium]